MVGLERRREVAVSTAAAIETNQVEPLRRRMSTERRDLSCAPEPPDHATDLGIREPVNGDRSFRTLAILCVVIAFVRAILVAMRCPPAAHRIAGFRGVSFDPIAAIGATDFWIRVWHRHHVAGIGCRGNGTMKSENAACVAAFTVAGRRFERLTYGL